MFGLIGEVRLLRARVPHQHLENTRRRVRKMRWHPKGCVLNKERVNPARLQVDVRRAQPVGGLKLQMQHFK